MLKQYPRFKLGDLAKLDKKLDSNNKKILDDFIILCSISARGKKLEKIRRHLVQFKHITQLDLDKQDINSIIGFLSLLNNSDRSIWTKNEVKVYVKKFLKWYYKNLEMIELIKTESRIDLNSQKITENNLIEEKDVEQMIRFGENFKEKALLFLLFETGCRPQEILDLKWRDVKFEDDYADVSFYSKKTGKQRIFPVNKSRKYLWDWKENYSYNDVQSNDLVFPSRLREQIFTTNGLNKMLRRLGKKAKLNKDVWGYLFRHSKATELYEELPITDVEKLMGHSNMYKVYSHLSNKKVRENLLNKIHKIKPLNPTEREELKNLKDKIDEQGKFISQLSEITLSFFESGLSNTKKKKYTKDGITYSVEDLKKNVEGWLKPLIQNGK